MISAELKMSENVCFTQRTSTENCRIVEHQYKNKLYNGEHKNNVKNEELSHKIDHELTCIQSDGIEINCYHLNQKNTSTLRIELDELVKVRVFHT